MASSKVMVSSAATNPDLPRISPSSSSLIHHQTCVLFPHTDPINCSFGSMNMDDLLRNMYNEAATDGNGGGGGGDAGWGEIGNGGGMTLEAYLAKAGAVTEEDVRVNVAAESVNGSFGMEGVVNSVEYQCGGFGGEVVGFGNGVAAVGATSGRGKRRVAADAPLDKATQQKQRRMIKNRESAARSRERKQAYTVELEALVTRLEEENARLVKEEAERKKERFKQLMEEVKKAVEKRRQPKAVMRRSRSMSW